MRRTRDAALKRYVQEGTILRIAEMSRQTCKPANLQNADQLQHTGLNCYFFNSCLRTQVLRKQYYCSIK